MQLLLLLMLMLMLLAAGVSVTQAGPCAAHCVVLEQRLEPKIDLRSCLALAWQRCKFSTLQHRHFYAVHFGCGQVGDRRRVLSKTAYAEQKIHKSMSEEQNSEVKLVWGELS